MQVEHVSIYIARASADVHEFASDPRNLPRWAAGLVRSAIRPDGDGWVVDAPFGTVRVTFAPRNLFGVMDGMSDERLAGDRAAVERDLRTLKGSLGEPGLAVGKAGRLAR